MSSTKPFNLRWGIIATGGISQAFTKDLILDPTVREVTDVTHTLAAVGSRSVASAEKFIKDIAGDDATAKGYGSYEEVCGSKDVDAVYIGTPHTYHYENAKDALNAGKHVLCEKPFTFDLAELDELIAIAKAKNLFLMEAVWTRFQPMSYKVQEAVFSGKYGKFKKMSADLSSNMEPAKQPLSWRMLDPALGGGALLDLGPYPMVWTMLLAHQNPLNKDRLPPKNIRALTTPDERTQVDDTTSWMVQWEGVGTSMCSASMSTAMSPTQAVAVQLELAEIVIHPPTYVPTTFTIYPKAPPASWAGAQPAPAEEPQTFTYPIHHGRGMHYQADEVARCIRDGKIESERCGWEESRIVMRVFDEVRGQIGYPVKEGKAGKGK